VIRAVSRLPYPLGRTGLSRALQGAKTSPLPPDRFPDFGALNGWTQKAIRELIARLEEQGLLEAYVQGRYRLLRLTSRGETIATREPIVTTTEPFSSPAPENSLSDLEDDVYERLRVWRLEKAREIEKPAFVIFHNSVLSRIATTRPSTLDELAAIKGVGPAKSRRYGQEVLSILASYGSR
jgi:ATP-dependent DNA helicase RecQ